MEEQYKKALKTKKIPILPLDQKWHRLFALSGKGDRIQELEEQLNEVLKRQGQLYTESKELKKIKSKLMENIRVNMDGANEDGKNLTKRKLEEDKRLIEEINEKLENHEEELLELPRQIDDVNRELMYETVQFCYDILKDNTGVIEEISQWIKQVRIDLKKNIIKKQNREINSKEIYSYMHDILGPEVIEVFDEEHEDIKLVIPEKKTEETNTGG
ncbi:MAG: hypothetical protein NC307_15325 [Roseburia sp.]|nr:hypothetical protein [Roseburia sp.]